MLTAIFLLLFGLLTSCNNDITFEKNGWQQKDDLGFYPNRNKMLNDLTINHNLKGLSYKKIIELIGEPEKNITANNSIFYNIITDYGHDIDPVYSKTLEI